MTIDATEVTAISSLSDGDVNSEIVTHGILDEARDDGFVLVEDSLDYRGSRFPVALGTDFSGCSTGVEVGSEDIGSYCLISGTLATTGSETPSFHSIILRVDEVEIFNASDEHAKTTSQSKVHEEVIDILKRFESTVPTRYVVETAVEEGYDRTAVEEMIERLRTAGEIYQPEQGHLGVL